MKKNKILIVIFLIFIVSLTISLTLGKYVYNSVWNYYLKSRNFYFESDLLSINEKNNSLLKWNGENIYFNIKNNSNDKLVSDYDISYKITCSVIGDESQYIECLLNDTDKATYNGTLTNISYCLADTEEDKKLNKAECELKGYVWYDEPVKKDNFFNLKLTNKTKQIDEVSVKIVVESISPYHKTLTGIFNLNKVEELETEYNVEYESLNDYDELIIINKTSEKKCFSIDFNSNDYLIDADNDSIKEVDYDELGKIKKIVVEIENNSSLNYNFYKLNLEKEYSINDFSIKKIEC